MKMIENYVNNFVCKPEITKYLDQAERLKLCVTDKFDKNNTDKDL
jgi:hypothetical protein